MPVITTSDGTEISFKDWGSGQPIVFSHGWPELLHNATLITYRDFPHGMPTTYADTINADLITVLES
jgi:pimeloyl-ACP methyl ester carboxylesterase